MGGLGPIPLSFFDPGCLAETDAEKKKKRRKRKKIRKKRKKKGRARLLPFYPSSWQA